MPLEVAFNDLIPAQEWQKIQDRFSHLLDICMQTVNPDGSIISQASMLPRFCSMIEKSSRMYEHSCAVCLPDFLGGKTPLDKNFSYCCDAGLFHFIAALKLREQAIAYVILGPVILVRRKEKEEYRPIADTCGLGLDELWDRLLEIKVISYQYMQAAGDLLKDTGALLLTYAYETFVRKAAISEDSALKPQAFFDDLLRLARVMTAAEIGSIMLFDRQRQKLTIKSSYGLPDEIAARAELSAGEGIAGIAAQENRAFIIDEKDADKRIRQAMKRPYLGQAMVIPLQVRDTTVGVMNLSRLKTSEACFDQGLLQQIQTLLALTVG